MVVNIFFDIICVYVGFVGGCLVDNVCLEGLDLVKVVLFKGNMDVVGLEKFIVEYGDDIVVIVMIVINNLVGG